MFSIYVPMSWPRSIYAVSYFLSYLYDLFFIFSLICIVINHMTSFKQKYLFFGHFLEYVLLFLNHNMVEESE